MGSSGQAPHRGWQWRLMAAIIVGIGAGFAVAHALGFGDAAAQSAIVAALTLAAGSSGRPRTAVPVAAILGVIVVAYSTLGALTTGYPLAAALAMAFVAFTTSVMTAAPPVGLLVGLVSSYAYFLVTGVGVIESRAVGGTLPQIGLLGLIGLLTGLALVALRAGTEQLLGTAPSRPHDQAPSLLAPMVASVRTFDSHAKDGVRRALALGVAMYGFQSLGTHNAFWVMLTVFVILAPNGRTTVQVAAIRVAGTFVGVISVVALAQLLPEGAAAPLGVIALAISLAASSRSSTVSAACGAAAGAVFTALPSGDFTGYAAARLLDTLIGAAVALAAGWLLWPGSPPTSAPVRPDLAADASATGITVSTA